MFAAYVFTIIDSQDMQERNRLGPVAVTPAGHDAADLLRVTTVTRDPISTG